MIHAPINQDSFQAHRDYEPVYHLVQVPLSEAGRERIWKVMDNTFERRWIDWRDRHDDLEGDRTYRLPRIHELYARALISEAQRDALHVTRKVLEALAHNSIQGRSGIVAEWSKVQHTISKRVLDEIKSEPVTAGERSLLDCIQILRANSYDMPEGVYSFVRTPLALRALERKYYLEDLATY